MTGNGHTQSGCPCCASAGMRSLRRLEYTETEGHRLDGSLSGIDHSLEDELVRNALPRELEVYIEVAERCLCETCRLVASEPGQRAVAELEGEDDDDDLEKASEQDDSEQDDDASGEHPAFAALEN